MTDLIEKAARALAAAMGDDLDKAFTSKSEWTAQRGERGGRYRDINEPFRADYFDAIRAVLEAIRPGDVETVEVGRKAMISWYEGAQDFDEGGISIFQSVIDHLLSNPNQEGGE